MTTTAQDVISVKLERSFDAYDANKDGYLDWSDYEQLGERYIKAYGLDKNDRRARAIVAFNQMSWLELLRHSGVDTTRLTKEQYVTANRLAAIDTSRLNVTEGGGHAIFDVIDVDGDNEISRAEFERFLREVWRSEAPDAMDAFSRLDTDGDGSISRQEFIRAIREYHFSSDPEAPGSLFYGQV
ncbi:EF-hand domain-containing protein [Streptomyces sp. NPDC090119]|uniref:EF-hand domain-containing protein n=1 Tax=Streptomyces sp. NPDC090119 TaxID=3365951 RepID=UPI0037F1AF5C